LRRIVPAAALPGAEVRLEGHALKPPGASLPSVKFSGVAANVALAAADSTVVRIPEGAMSGGVIVEYEGPGGLQQSNELPLNIGVPIADNLHPVANPALDADGNIYVTFSGARGQKVPVSLYKLDTNYTMKPFSTAIVSPTGVAVDRDGVLYVSSRQDGTIYKVLANGTAAPYAEGMGVATGIAFDSQENLYVGDRSGTIFKIDRKRDTFVFATLEPSVAAYHLAFGPDGYLYVAGPSTSSFDPVWRISPAGVVTPFFRGLGRPQGLAFDEAGHLYVAASLRGRRGVVRISPEAEAELVVSGLNLVGLAFARGPAMILATNNALFHLEWNVAGAPLPPAS